MLVNHRIVIHLIRDVLNLLPDSLSVFFVKWLSPFYTGVFLVHFPTLRSTLPSDNLSFHLFSLFFDHGSGQLLNTSEILILGYDFTTLEELNLVFTMMTSVNPAFHQHPRSA